MSERLLEGEELVETRDHMEKYLREHYRAEYVSEKIKVDLYSYANKDLIYLQFTFPHGVHVDRVLELKNEAKAYVKEKFCLELPESQINTAQSYTSAIEHGRLSQSNGMKNSLHR